MFAPVKHILPMTMIRRERVLPAAGKVLVRAGQKVGTSDVVAETKLHPEYVLLDIARSFRMSADKADKYIGCQAGDQIAAGDIVAGPIGFTRRLFRSPSDGRVALAGSGQVLLEIAGKPYQVKAGIPGDVVELIPDFGVVIETGGALVQGLWGNGKVEFGALRALAKTPEAEIKPADLDISLRGSVVLAGYCNDAQVLKIAEELPLRGLILSSMGARLATVAQRLSMAVVVLEGFGKYPFNPMAFKLLSTNDERPTAIIAETSDGYNGKRPEVVIPLPVPGNVNAPPEMVSLAPNQTVRLLRPPKAGEIGQIVSIKSKVLLPSGLRSSAAEVRLENNQMVTVPLVNLEAIA